MKRMQQIITLLLVIFIVLVAVTEGRPDETPDITPSAQEREPPEVTDEGLAYLETMLAETDEITKQYHEVGTLLGTPKYDDAVWIDKITTALVKLNSHAKALQSLEPPGRFQRAHAEFVATGVRKLIEATDLMPGAIDTRNGSQITQATDYMMDYTIAFADYTDALGDKGE